MWPLLVLSIVSIAVIIEREIFFFRNRQGAKGPGMVRDLVLSGREADAVKLVQESESSVMRLIASVLKNSEKSSAAAEKEISLEGDRILFSASRYIHVQELIGSISPLIGLSGTVLGLVQAFRNLDLSSVNQIDASLLAGGIWVAMITTVAGLFTAIPSLIFAHINRNRVKNLAFSMKMYGEEINTLLREGQEAPTND